MKYWDASGIVPLLVKEVSTAARQLVLDADPMIVTWWATRVDPLRAADALQLAAAIAAAHGDPSTLAFISGDDRLSAAADIEGFPVA